MLGLLFHPEDGGTTFIENVGWLHRTPPAYIPEDRTLQVSLRFIKEGNSKYTAAELNL
jgi:hypothetical protein